MSNKVNDLRSRVKSPGHQLLETDVGAWLPPMRCERHARGGRA